MTYVKRILKASPRETKTIDERFMKLNEEVGEIAVAILHSRGLKHTDQSKKEMRENILEEICDSIIVLYSMASWHKFTEKQITKMMNKKLDKWEGRLKK
jgi:NTP pyrophosphatase (non-canonical NTP hydrolase)